MCVNSTDFVVLGGTAEQGKWDTTVEQEVSRRILENCSKIMGSVKVCTHILFVVIDLDSL